MTFASGLSFPEGPVALADGSWLCVEGGSERGCVTQISPGGNTKRGWPKPGGPTGWQSIAMVTSGWRSLKRLLFYALRLMEKWRLW